MRFFLKRPYGYHSSARGDRVFVRVCVSCALPELPPLRVEEEEECAGKATGAGGNDATSREREWCLLCRSAMRSAVHRMSLFLFSKSLISNSLLANPCLTFSSFFSSLVASLNCLQDDTSPLRHSVFSSSSVSRT